MIKNINWKLDWSEATTQRGAIMAPLVLIALWLAIVDKVTAAVVVLSFAQTIYTALGIAISDKPKK